MNDKNESVGIKQGVSMLALQTAAGAWCREETKHTVMDPALCSAFAYILEEVWTKPWLGNATTGQLLDEIKARVDCSYRTAGGVLPYPESTST